ncbi:MAG: hypothetical protein ACKO40_14015 [Planctomycetaceae bacterium]
MLRHAAILATALVLVTPGGRVGADTPAVDRGDVASLADRLKSGLRVKAPRDVAFVETVAERVQEGRLPEKLVDSTYLWAVRRGKKYPFPAFEHVIRLQADKLGVPLD